MGILGRFFGKKQDKHWDAFYQRFEDRFRGSPELIVERLQTRYGELLKGHARSHLGTIAMDLGCGRGEFLSIARDYGFTAKGIDFNKEAVARCVDQGFEVTCGDLLSSMTKSPNDSCQLLTSFHVVEHCSAKYVLEVFREAYRILATDGLFVVETPSLYSLWASARQFYLDPTHERPVHPEFLRFMGEDIGFRDIQLMEFDEAEGPDIATFPGGDEVEPLKKWLYGPMDLALVMKK